MKFYRKLLCRPHIIAIAFSALLTFQFSEVLANGKIVLPNPELFGKQIGKVPPLVLSGVDKSTVFPENVHLDLNGPVVYGIMANYPESVTLEQLVDAVNRKHKKWSRDPNGEMLKYGVTVWRNEDKRYSIQVSNQRVIMIWLDREITQKEVEAVTKALLDGVTLEGVGQQPD